MDLPILANYLQFTDSNWKYKAMPTGKYCMGMDNGQCNFPRGKVVGGSSVLNYMIYTRGHRKDYDNWAQLGNDGWSYDDILPYFRKVEHFEVDDQYDPKYHGKDGYLSVGYAPYKTKIADALIEAGLQSGLPYVDYNGRSQVGISRIQASLKDGVRHSSSRAYLHPIRGRRNLHLKKQTMVTKLLIDPVTKQADGVEFVTNGRTYTVRASKEVIVSAGAINSPQLLMLSGIGPKKHLNALGIPVVQNLKVGYNLMDHIALGGLTFIIDKPYSVSINKILQREPMAEYFNNHTGPLSIPGGCEVLAFVDLDHPGDPNGHPDIEFLFEAGSIVSDPLLHKDFGVTDELYNQVFKSIEKRETFMGFPMLLRPKSRGRIILENKDYRTKPLIFPNYFAFKEDLDKMVQGAKALLRMMEQPALKKLGLRLHTTPIPQCASLGFGTDEYLGCMARYITLTIYHQSGTCKMGPQSDKKAVVDPRLRVRGMKKLRVIDASIIPVIPAAHTNAIVFMIAEKGADLVKEDWGAL